MKSYSNELLSIITQKVSDNENFSYVRYGDAELMCMTGTYHGHTKDKHSYSKELSADLITAFINLCEYDNVYMGRWDRSNHERLLNNLISKYNIQKQFVSFHILSSEMDYINAYQYKFYETIKYSKRKKIFVAHEGLAPMLTFLNTDNMVTIPKINAYDHIQNIKSQCISMYEPNAIYVYCAGMNTKVLIDSTISEYTDTTHIDVGSAFEPFFNTGTRSKHVTSEYLQTYYEQLL